MYFSGTPLYVRYCDFSHRDRIRIAIIFSRIYRFSRNLDSFFQISLHLRKKNPPAVSNGTDLICTRQKIDVLEVI